MGMKESIDDGVKREQVIEKCCEHRAMCLELEKKVRSLMDDPVFGTQELSPGTFSEMRANIMLAVRHMEDARMRIGKVIQASDGGVSCYNR